MILIRDRKFSKNEKPADSKVIDKIVKEERLNLGKPNSEEIILDDLAKYDYQTGTKHTKFVDEESALIQENKDKIMFLLGFENYSRLQKSKLFSDKKKDKKSTVIKSSIAGSGVIGSDQSLSGWLGVTVILDELLSTPLLSTLPLLISSPKFTENRELTYFYISIISYFNN